MSGANKKYSINGIYGEKLDLCFTLWHKNQHQIKEGLKFIKRKNVKLLVECRNPYLSSLGVGKDTNYKRNYACGISSMKFFIFTGYSSLSHFLFCEFLYLFKHMTLISCLCASLYMFFVLCSSNFFALGIQTVPKFKCPLLTFVRWAEVWKAARGAVCPGQMSCGSGMPDCIWNLQIPVWVLLRLLDLWNILLTTAAPFSSQFARLSDSMDRGLWTEGKAKETTLIVLELEWTVGPQIYTSREGSVFRLAKQSLAWSKQR